MNTTSKCRASQIAHDILFGFSWSDTDEGHDYWREVYMALQKYTPAGFEPKDRYHAV